MALLGAAPAQALVTPPVTVDGPSPLILGFGGVSMAADGSGGLVYVKAVEGVPHVFASRYAEGRWGAPIRVDWDQSFAASEPQIAAGPGGRLLVVWVTEVATVHGKIQHALFSATIAAGAPGFGHSLVVDPNVGNGIGVAPSLSGTSANKAIVAYRVITFDFSPGTFSTAVQLRPGDVMADIRVARLAGSRWSRLGAMNANPEASMRPPSPTDGPQVGTGLDGSAVVAWQEPDQSGAARILMRRIFGTTPGPVLQVSPTSWEGAPLSADVDAFSLSVTPYTQAFVGMRVAATAGSALAGQILVNSLPPTFATTAGTLTGPKLANGAAPLPGAAGPPAVAGAETGQKEALVRVAFTAGTGLRQVGAKGTGAMSELGGAQALPAPPAGPPVIAIDPDGGEVLAYPALDSGGLPVVAVRQEFESGEVQSGLLSGVQGGPVSELQLGRSGTGDGLIGFLQGEPGYFEVVAGRASVPPSSFSVEAPKKWTRPNQVKLTWQAAATTGGPVHYTVLVDGRSVKENLGRRSFHPRPGMLGNGTLEVQVLATDSLGQERLSKAAKLRVDGQPPTVAVGVGKKRTVHIRIRDVGSGVRGAATRVRYGDGDKAHGGSNLHHAFAGPGRYAIRVRARDQAGNRVSRTFRVSVR
ncbi:MAG: PKD domain-containing protein [Solirubrobacterales bacterium]